MIFLVETILIQQTLVPIITVLAHVHDTETRGQATWLSLFRSQIILPRGGNDTRAAKTFALQNGKRLFLTIMDFCFERGVTRSPMLKGPIQDVAIEIIIAGQGKDKEDLLSIFVQHKSERLIESIQPELG